MSPSPSSPASLDADMALHKNADMETQTPFMLRTRSLDADELSHTRQEQERLSVLFGRDHNIQEEGALFPLGSRKHSLQSNLTCSSKSVQPGTVRKLPRRSLPMPLASAAPMNLRATPLAVTCNHTPKRVKTPRTSHTSTTSGPPAQSSLWTTPVPLVPTPSVPIPGPSHQSSVQPHQQLPPSNPRFLTAIAPTSLATPSVNENQCHPNPSDPYHMQKVYTSTTATTANSTFEDATLDTSDTTISPVSTPFRFTSFPASLPRVHPPPRNHSKFYRSSSTDDAQQQLHSVQSTTNISHTGINNIALPPPVQTTASSNSLDESSWKSPRASCSDTSSTTSSTAHAKMNLLFDASSFEEESPASRTRLNFTAMLDGAVGPGESNLQKVPTIDSRRVTTSPSDVPLFRLDQPCSPIVGIDEDDDDRLSPVQEGPKSLDSSTSSSSSSSSNSKMRQLRPMPDMSAFEGMPLSASMATTATALTGASTMERGLPCPPTPVRTPAWAHNHTYIRSNSLIETKVLATGFRMEDFGSRRTSLSFSTVFDEDNDDDDDDDLQSHTGSKATEEYDDEDDDEEFGKSRSRRRRLRRHSGDNENHDTHHKPVVVSFSDFDVLGQLGRGAFADVYKVRFKTDGRFYAIKRNRRQFRGKRDREIALTEVKTMQQLQQQFSGGQCPYVLTFYRAWQEEGYFFCQTELCCRHTCREIKESLLTAAAERVAAATSTIGQEKQNANVSGCFSMPTRFPILTIWKICHDVTSGLTHIHQHGIVHNDLKPSNIFLISHPVFGAVCKIGDFGNAGQVGTEGREGDTTYMPPELLSLSALQEASADMFSLGLTLYELVALIPFLPTDGSQWHELRNGTRQLALPSPGQSESTQDVNNLLQLLQNMIHPEPSKRPTAPFALEASRQYIGSTHCDIFLKDYVAQIEANDVPTMNPNIAANSSSMSSSSLFTSTTLPILPAASSSNNQSLSTTITRTPRTSERNLMRTPTGMVPPVPPMLFTPPLSR